jgi:hypothetical protein
LGRARTRRAGLCPGRLCRRLRQSSPRACDRSWRAAALVGLRSHGPAWARRYGSRSREDGARRAGRGALGAGRRIQGGRSLPTALSGAPASVAACCVRNSARKRSPRVASRRTHPTPLSTTKIRHKRLRQGPQHPETQRASSKLPSRLAWRAFGSSSSPKGRCRRAPKVARRSLFPRGRAVLPCPECVE